MGVVPPLTSPVEEVRRECSETPWIKFRVSDFSVSRGGKGNILKSSLSSFFIYHFPIGFLSAQFPLGCHRVLYSRAAVNSAKRFLDTLIKRSSFTIKAIQVDGSSEFKSEFETACRRRGIRPFVLPPRSPELSGCVEGTQGTYRYEFYEAYGLPGSCPGYDLYCGAGSGRTTS